MITLFGRTDLMILVLESLLFLACLAWILASAARAVRHVLTVQRRRASLARRHANLERDLDTVRHSVRQQESALHALDKTLADKQAEAAVVQARLDALRGEGLREYQVLTERFGDKDRLWLLTVPRPDRPARWAVAAPDAQAATDLLSKRLSASEKPAVEGPL